MSGDRQNFSDGQEIIYQDLNKIPSRAERFLLDKVIFELLGRNASGFFQDSLSVSRVSNNELSVRAGLGFQLNETDVFEPDNKPVFLSANESVIVPTANPSQDRIDIVTVRAALQDSQTETRKFKDAFSSSISTSDTVVSKEWLAEVVLVEGVPSATPAVPATPAGYVKLAEVLVEAANGVTAAVNITDSRELLPLAATVGTTGSRDYDAVIGDTNEIGFSHETLKAALDDSAIQSGAKILVTRDETIDITPEVTKDNIEIVFKPNVTLTKGTQTKGLIINANGVRITNGRFADFSTGGDIAIEIGAANDYNMIRDVRFLNCDTTISGLDAKNTQTGSIEE
jgi:hypothetical protein